MHLSAGRKLAYRNAHRISLFVAGRCKILNFNIIQRRTGMGVTRKWGSWPSIGNIVGTWSQKSRRTSAYL